MDARIVVNLRSAVDGHAVHHVQNKCRLLAIFVLRFILGAALENLDCLRFMLAGGGKQNPVDGRVREVVRRNVLSFLGDHVGRDHAVQIVGRNNVFPDVPGRRSSSFWFASVTQRIAKMTLLPSKSTSTSLTSRSTQFVTEAVMLRSGALGEARSRI